MSWKSRGWCKQQGKWPHYIKVDGEIQDKLEFFNLPRNYVKLTIKQARGIITLISNYINKVRRLNAVKLNNLI